MEVFFNDRKGNINIVIMQYEVSFKLYISLTHRNHDRFLKHVKV